MKEIFNPSFNKEAQKVIELVKPEKVKFKAVRARGPGGQRVNRRSTKIQAWVKIEDLSLSNQQKKMIREKLANHINEKDELEVIEEEESFQSLNKKRALERLNEWIKEAIKEKPPRLSSQPPFSAKEKRIEEKKMKSQKKKSRSYKYQKELF